MQYKAVNINEILTAVGKPVSRCESFLFCVCDVFFGKKKIIWREFIGIMADDSYVDLEFSELLGWLGGI